MNYTSKIIFLFAAMSASTAASQTNPWVTAVRPSTVKQINHSATANKYGSRNVWLSSKNKEQKPTPHVLSNAIRNPWMKPTELKTTTVPGNKN
jgi:hypothetical protein